MDHLRVGTLNIWNRSGPWEERRALLRAGLAEHDFDLFAMQEVLQLETGDLVLNQVADLLGDRAMHWVYGKGHDMAHAHTLAQGLSFGNALLSKHPIVHHEVHELPGAAQSDQQRSVLYAVVEAPCGQVPVFVTHLNWKLHEGRIRVQQVKAIVRLIMERCPVGQGYPPLLMGDLNAEPDADEIRFLRGLATIDDESVYFTDAFHYAGEGPGYTYHPENPYAAVVHEPPRRLDYVFVRGPDKQLRGKPLACRRIFDRPTGDVWPSDHYGVLCDLSV